MSPDLELLLQYRDTRRCELFEAIVAHHGPMVFRAALRVLRDHHEAEDVVQLTFIELAKHPEAAGPHLIGWLHRTATNAATDLVRSRARPGPPWSAEAASRESVRNPVGSSGHLPPFLHPDRGPLR